MTALTLAIGLAFGGFLLADAERQSRHRHRVVLAGDRLLDRGQGAMMVLGVPDLDPRAADPGAGLDGGRRLAFSGLRDLQGRHRRPQRASRSTRARPDLHRHLLRDALRGDHVHRLRDGRQPRGGDGRAETFDPDGRVRERHLRRHLLRHRLVRPAGGLRVRHRGVPRPGELPAALRSARTGSSAATTSPRSCSGWSCSTSRRSASARRRHEPRHTSRSARDGRLPRWLGPRQRPLPHARARQHRAGGRRDHRDLSSSTRPTAWCWTAAGDRPGRVVRLLPVGRDIRRHVPGAGLPGGQPDGLPGQTGREPRRPGDRGGGRGGRGRSRRSTAW